MITYTNEVLTEEQWKQRYINYLLRHSNCEQWYAEESADVAWEYIIQNNFNYSPEQDAADELSCW